MTSKAIFIGADHAGFNLKEIVKKFLAEKDYHVEDVGPHRLNPDDDYPDYAVKVCEKVLENNAKGILICGTGQGMDRVANKIPGIQAAVCWDESSARIAKEHGNVNVLCFGGRVVKPDMAKRMVETWLDTAFKNEDRHVRRIDKIKKIDMKRISL